MTTDIFTSKDKDDAGQGLEVRQKYAMAELYLAGTTTELGLTHTPSDQYDSDLWPYRVQGKHFLDRHSIQASADLGLNIRGTLRAPPWTVRAMPSTGPKLTTGNGAATKSGIYNGPGYTNLENNTQKAVSGMVYFRPAPGVDLLKGLQLAYYGTFGKSNTTFYRKGENQRISRLAGQHRPASLAAQVVHPDGPVLLG